MRRIASMSAKLRIAAATGACLVGLMGGATRALAGDVTVPGNTDFPESFSGTSDGSMYFGSFAGGRIFRSEPGASEAKEFIKPSNGLSSILGVLADEKSGTLYVCSDDVRWGGITIPGGDEVTSLKLFDLKTGAFKQNLPLPASTIAGQGPLCNDIVVGPDGAAYVTDSLSGHILRLKPGATSFEIWAHDARWDVKGPQLDGIAISGGAMYSNLFEGDGLYRIAMNADGSAGEITKLKTSHSLYHSDGLRAFAGGRLLMVEGETKGTLDLITVTGDEAKVDTVKGDFKGPVSLWQNGDTVYVLDVPLSYMFDAKLKGKGPAFTAFAVKAPQ